MPRPRRNPVIADESAEELPVEVEDVDPEPGAVVKRGRGRPVGSVSGRTAAKAKVNAEICTLAMLFAGAWGMRDPECADEITEKRVKEFAKHFTEMLARNPTWLDYAAKTGIIGDIIGMGGAVWPVAKAVWKAHGPGGTGHGEVQAVSQGELNAKYPAYAGPGRA